MPKHPFQLCVLTDRPNEYGLDLYQEPHADKENNGQADRWKLVARVWGTPLKVVMD